MEICISQIRKFLNRPLKKHQLLNDHAIWNQVYSSLDVIEDTTLAINAYKNSSVQSKGEKYLIVYGLLQAFFLQQDAIENLSEALNLSINLSSCPRLMEIREIRNDAIGHPTKRNRKAQRSYHYISQISLELEGFTLCSYYDDGKNKFRDIDILELIKDQEKYAKLLMEAVIDVLKAEEIKHKEKYRMDKLSAVFSSTMDHHFEKLFQGISQNSYRPMSYIQLGLIKSDLVNFKNKIDARYGSLEMCGDFKDQYDLITFSLTALEAFFNGHNDCICDKTAKIFTCFLQDEVRKVMEMAREIDEDYSSK